jgi:hypothetical protein
LVEDAKDFLAQIYWAWFLLEIRINR